MASHSTPQPIVVTHESGVKFAVQIRTHRIIVDQPVSASGRDAGPTPLELLGASLGSCVALYVQQFFRVRGVEHPGVRVEVEQRGAAHPSRVGQFTARVILPAELPEPTRALVERVARSCPAHNTLVLGADVSVEVRTEVEPSLV